ncbi:MAG: translational GTPase TypA [Verrucomicrobiota bacterium]|nr:translational GTPase TypA [Verrucomicrobiota bacterium]
MSIAIRNIAIIAHVDHGKTTLVDQLLRQGGAFRANQQVAERIMDSMDLEREKGITIKAKNTSVHWEGNVINIVDTPGHADFGAEVERVMKMVDGVLLVVDAYDGPQAQTRFVLRKALQSGLVPIVVINKVDRENSDAHKVHDKVLELFLELHASEEQFHCPFIYASAKNGFAIRDMNDERKDMRALFETIMSHIPAPRTEEGAFRMLISNIGWSDFVGRIAIGKILSGTVRGGDTVYVIHRDGSRERCKISKIFEYTGTKTSDSIEGIAGDIVGMAGFNDIDIGETLAADETAPALPFVEIDPPTIQMEFAVNDGPFVGQDGKLVTSRQIRDRLVRESKTNISIKISDTSEGGTFIVAARGAMQIAILVEQMRREGFELLVSRPSVITKVINGQTCEPFETLWVEVPDTQVGGIMQNLAARKARVENMEKHAHGMTIEATVPTRGLIGFEFDLMNMTSGEGVMSHLFKEYGPWAGEIITRITGTLVATDTGMATAYALDNLESRGKLFVTSGDMIYQGMIVGENPRLHDLPVNPTKEKQLSNVRSQGEGKGIQLSPPMKFTLERAIEYIAPDEYVEATPKIIRLRKKELNPNERKRTEKSAAALA